MATVNNIRELRPTFQVDNNTLLCRAAKNDDESTIIVLMTPKNAWVKNLVITTSTVYGYKLQCGDKAGNFMQGLNENNKFNKVDLGNVPSGISIQFIKPKELGRLKDFGTMKLPSTVAGHTIVFFWPHDGVGELRNSTPILDQANTVTSTVAGIADNVLAVGRDADALLALFK